MDLEQLLSQEPIEEISNDVVAEAVRIHKEGKREQLVAKIGTVLEHASRVVNERLAQLRAIRKQEKIAASNLKKISAATEYFKQSGNPLPYYKACGQEYAAHQFCASLGVDVPDAKSHLWNIPEQKEADADAS